MLTIQNTDIEHVNYCVCNLLSERGGKLRRILASCNQFRECTTKSQLLCTYHPQLGLETIPVDDGCEVTCGEDITSCENDSIYCPCCECEPELFFDQPFDPPDTCTFKLSSSNLPDGSREDRVIALLSQATDSSLLSQPSSPQAMAANWIIKEDNLAVETFSLDEKRSLLQRYALSVLYFATNGDDWLYCSARENSECGTSRFPGKKRFLSNASECDWAGVECGFGGVSSIRLGKRWLSVLVSLVIGFDLYRG